METKTDFTTVMEDVYDILFKGNPRLKERTEENKHQRTVMSAIKNSKEIEKLRKNTKFDAWESTISTYQMADKIARLIQKQQQQEQKGGDQQGNQEQLQKEIENMLKNQAEKAQQRAETIPQELREDEKKAGQGQGGIELSSRRAPIKAKEIWDRLMQNKPSMIKYLGRMKSVTGSIGKAKLNSKTATITGIELGNNIMDLTPTERMLFKNQKIHRMMLQKFTQRKLRCWEHKQKVKAGQGNIIVLLDKSGSMGNSKESEGMVLPKMDLAITFTYGIIMAAKKTKRNMIVIPFNGTVDEKIIIEKGRYKREQIEKLLQIDHGGGTSYNRALEASFEAIEAYPKQTKNADIVIITDDDCCIGSEHEKTLKKLLSYKNKGMKVYLIRLGYDRETEKDLKEMKATAHKDSLFYWADEVYPDLSDKTLKSVGNNIVNRKEDVK